MNDAGSGGPAADRVTPWSLVFAAPGFEAARFSLVAEQADAAGAHSPASLLLLPAAGELLRELGGEPAGADAASRQDAIGQAGALLFHGYRFWRHGRRVYDVAAAALEAALAAPAAGWQFRTPAAAGYVQLPHHLFWASVAEGAVPEPVDGFFWSAPGGDERSGSAGDDRLDLLLVLGLRRGRPGLSLVDVTAEPALQLERWIDVDARPDGADFANVLPGGELQGYRALTTRAEALKLAVICFRVIDERGARQPGGDAPEDIAAVQRYRVDG